MGANTFRFIASNNFQLHLDEIQSLITSAE